MKIEFRVKDHEYEIISRLSDGYKSLSDYVRQAAMSEPKENPLDGLIGSHITDYEQLLGLLLRKSGARNTVELKNWLLDREEKF